MLCLFVKRGGKVAKELTLKQEINYSVFSGKMNVF
jgi:hypothetical protein